MLIRIRIRLCSYLFISVAEPTSSIEAAGRARAARGRVFQFLWLLGLGTLPRDKYSTGRLLWWTYREHFIPVLYVMYCTFYSDGVRSSRYYILMFLLRVHQKHNHGSFDVLPSLVISTCPFFNNAQRR